VKASCFLLLVFTINTTVLAADDRFQPSDLARLADLAEPDLSNDGNTVVYTVTTAVP